MNEKIDWICWFFFPAVQFNQKMKNVFFFDEWTRPWAGSERNQSFNSISSSRAAGEEKWNWLISLTALALGAPFISSIPLAGQLHSWIKIHSLHCLLSFHSVNSLTFQLACFLVFVCFLGAEPLAAGQPITHPMNQKTKQAGGAVLGRQALSLHSLLNQSSH